MKASRDKRMDPNGIELSMSLLVEEVGDKSNEGRRGANASMIVPAPAYLEYGTALGE
jgi:hypothetical protein